MSLEDRLLARLKAEQQQFSLDALRRPVQRDAFEYGYRVGVVAGYEAAVTALLALLADERHGERDL